MARIHSRKKSRRRVSRRRVSRKRVSRRRVSRRRVSRRRVSRRRVSRRRVSRKKHTSRHNNIRKRMHYRMNDDRKAAISYLRRIKEIQGDINAYGGNPESRYLKDNKDVYQEKIDELRKTNNWGMFSGKWREIKREADLPINDVTNMDTSRRPGCIGDGTCHGYKCAACRSQ